MNEVYTYGTCESSPRMKMPQQWPWNTQHGEFHVISQDNWAYSNKQSSKYFVTINCIHNTNFRAQIITFCGQNFAKNLWHKYAEDKVLLHTIMWKDKACFMHEVTFIVHKVTSVYAIILMLAVNRCIKSSSGSMFELMVANTKSWSPVCYLTCQQLNESCHLL